MPNELTGEFDVVAEFAVPAINRLLAAMHRVERMPHSVSVRVDDITPPDSRFDRMPVIEAVDEFGDVVADQDDIGYPVPITSDLVGGRGSLAFPNAVLNPIRDIPDPRIQPSELQGRAQLQISTPKVEIADTSGTNVTVKMGILARYLPDPGTPPVAEFIRGELTVNAPITQVASQAAGRVIEVDIRSTSTTISFGVLWSSTPISFPDQAGLTLLVQNAFKTAFLPSNSPLPEGVSHIQFKTLTGPTSAVAVMLNMSDPAGNRASLTNLFLSANDDFGFAVGVDYVRAAFQPTLASIRAEPVQTFTYKVTAFGYTIATATYTIKLTDASVELHNGLIRLVVKGQARTGTTLAPNFDFDAKLDFSLVADGDTANLVPGNVSLSTGDFIAGLIIGRATSRVREMRDRVLAEGQTNQSVRDMMSAENNLAAFLDSLLKPAQAEPVVEPRLFSLAYSAVEIRPSGIILHGSLSVTAWPPAHVQFEVIPSSSSGGLGSHPLGISSGPDYSALKSWIPGGTIESFEWKRQGQPGPGLVDTNKFVRIDQGPTLVADVGLDNLVIPGPPYCLTLRGKRLSSAGPVVEQQVTATVCGYSVPVVGGAWENVDLGIVIAGAGTNGNVEVYGHAAAGASSIRGSAPNLVVTFGGDGGGLDFDAFTRALRESGRSDAAVAFLSVVDAGQLARTRYVEGVTYAEDEGGKWSRRFGVTDSPRPLTIIVSPFGKTMWKGEGREASASLAAALRQNLSRSSPRRPPMRSASIRIGHRPPNFIFELAPGRELTLRKLIGKKVTLVFWNNGSKPSADALEDLERRGAKSGDSLILAVHGEEMPESRTKQSAGTKTGVIHVSDPGRRISSAYGITMWPTVISIDALGAVRTIEYGRQSGDSVNADRSSQ